MRSSYQNYHIHLIVPLYRSLDTNSVRMLLSSQHDKEPLSEMDRNVEQMMLYHWAFDFIDISTKFATEAIKSHILESTPLTNQSEFLFLSFHYIYFS